MGVYWMKLIPTVRRFHTTGISLWVTGNGPRPLCPNPVHFGMKGNGLVSPRIFGWAERDSSYFRTFDKQKEIARARYHQGKQQKQIGFVYRKCNWSRLYPTNLYHSTRNDKTIHKVYTFFQKHAMGVELSQNCWFVQFVANLFHIIDNISTVWYCFDLRGLKRTHMEPYGSV